ncbi:hypothetical protein FRC06_004211 [Ceratobasidium sp. 370]|nr:hypothetical protein FRC06_004211 [Ceratobasidium sp. 370]
MMNASPPKIPAKSSKGRHVTDPLTLYNACAYVVVVPEPKRGVYGIKQFEDPETAGPNKQRGQYLFWVKIGDGKNPFRRLQQYTNPDQGTAAVRFKDSPSPSPGKALEVELLRDIGATDTEWHALFARDIEGARVLRKLLFKFLQQYPAPKTAKQPLTSQVYKTFVQEFNKVIAGCYRNDFNTMAKEIDFADGYQVHVVYIVVTPSIYSENCGFSGRTASNTESETYWIEVNSARTKTSTACAFMAERFKSYIPSFSYNGFRVQDESEVDECVEYILRYLEDLLRLAGNDNYGWDVKKQMWWVIAGGDFDRTLLQQYVDWFDQGPRPLFDYVLQKNPTPRSQTLWQGRRLPQISEEDNSEAMKPTQDDLANET